MGGQGGGVLADWIVAPGRSRTARWRSPPRCPASPSAPAPRSITSSCCRRTRWRAADAVADADAGRCRHRLASELMEAGRSVLRGLVTPDRTTLIASTHRAFAMAEKQTPGDGIGDPTSVIEATDFAASRTIAFDMETLAHEERQRDFGSAVRRAGRLPARCPFPRRPSRRRSGPAARASSRACEPSRAAYDARADSNPSTVSASAGQAARPAAGHGRPSGAGPARRPHPRRIFRPKLHADALCRGARQLTDFQDPAYAGDYLDRVAGCCRSTRQRRRGAAALPSRCRRRNIWPSPWPMTMSSGSPISRCGQSRFERVRKEVGAKDDQIVYTTEYMHPRMEEVCGTLPKAARALDRKPARASLPWLDRRVNKGRRVKTGTIFWFLGLYMVSGLRRPPARHAAPCARNGAYATPGWRRRRRTAAGEL